MLAALPVLVGLQLLLAFVEELRYTFGTDPCGASLPGQQNAARQHDGCLFASLRLQAVLRIRAERKEWWRNAQEVSRISGNREGEVRFPSRLKSKKTILDRKSMLREVFQEIHRSFIELDRQHFRDTGGIRVEFGAGVAPIRDTDPSLLATDVVRSPELDRVLDAQAMHLPASSVHAFYGQNCFHHFPKPARFFEEVIRVVKTRRRVYSGSAISRPVCLLPFQADVQHRGFDKQMPGWNVPWKAR